MFLFALLYSTFASFEGFGIFLYSRNLSSKTQIAMVSSEPFGHHLPQWVFVTMYIVGMFLGGLIGGFVSGGLCEFGPWYGLSFTCRV